MPDKDDENLDPSKAVEELIAAFGGREQAEEFLAETEKAVTLDAFRGIHEMYQGLRQGGFRRGEALQLLAFYILGMITGEEE